MRILQVVDIAYEIGGAEKSVKLIRDALRAQGHEVLVLSTDKGVAGRDVFADELIPVIAGPLPMRFAKHLWYGAAYRRTRQLRRDFQPDVVHLHTISEFSPSLLWALGSTPAVMTIHGPEEFTRQLLPWLLPDGDYRGGTYNWADILPSGRLRLAYYRCVQRPLYRLALRRLKLVIAPSQFMAEAVAADFPRTPITQLYNGIKLLPATPLPHGAHDTILFVGRLEAVKGVDHLIRAFGRLRERFPETRLRIIGIGSQQAELEALVETLKLAKSVTFLGWIVPERIHREFTAASMLVVPSVWPENLPTVAIEALATGRPIVGTKTGGVAELVIDGSNGFIVEPGDDAALTDAVSRLLADPRRLQSAAKASRRLAGQFDLAPFIDRLLTIYKDAAQ